MDQYIAEIRMFGCNFPPQGWALCNGQILPISQNTALFSLIGTYYGGNGTSNFALPDFQGNAGNSFGNAPGLSPYNLGQTDGSQNVTLLPAELAIHNHTVNCNNDAGSNQEPTNNVLAASGADRGSTMYSDGTTGNTVAMNPTQIVPKGNSQPHNNMSPFLALNYSIALVGVFPPRS